MKTAFIVGMCLVLGTGFVGGCTKRASAPPGTTGTPYSEVLGPMHVEALPPGEAEAAVAELGLERHVFEYAMPADSRCTLWVETYVYGTLAENLCWWQSHSAGRAIKDHFVFSILNADKIADPGTAAGTDSGRVRWRSGFGPSGSMSHWIDDPMQGFQLGSGTNTNKIRDAEYGKTYVAFWMLGHDGSYTFGENVNMNDWPSQYPVVVFYKVRFDKVEKMNSIETTLVAGDGMPRFED